MRSPHSEFLPMNAFAPYVAAIHLQDLLQDAETARRAKLASAAQPSISAWRRGLGGILASAARSLDPSIGERSAKGRGARAMAS